MPPKAKARFRRPAAAVGVLRRPAALGREEPEVVRRCRDLVLADLPKLRVVQLVKARYYGREVDLVGKFVNMRLEDGKPYAVLRVTGTRDEAILRSLSGKEDREMLIHLCEEGCHAALTEEFLAHGDVFREVGDRDEAWFTNLEKVTPPVEERDELALLQKEEERRQEEVVRGGAGTPKEKKRDKKEAGKEKRAREIEEIDKRRRSESEGDLEIGQKDPSLLFESTGLDPDRKRRNKIIAKAKKLGRSKKRKKKKQSGSSGKSSASSSSSSPSSQELGTVSLFESEKRLKVIWKRAPGALACSAASEAKQHLLTASGAVWGLDRKRIDPVFTHYARQCLTGHMSPPMTQETVTVAQCLDMLLQGHVAAACDVLAQRMKSLEASARGTHWSVARQLELIRGEGTSMAEEAETLDAARRAREEEKLRSMTSRPPGTRTSDVGTGGKGAKKGKDWKGGKGKQEEGGKGKGGEKKDDGKSWQKDRK